jgi:small-conductance mechanosensitive channel
LRKLLLMILGVTIAAVVLVLLLLNPDKIDSSSFWGHLGWIIFLVSINWLISAMFLSNASSINGEDHSYMGVLPSLNITIFSYSVISLLLIGLNILGKVYFEFNPVKDYHLVLQIIAASFCLVLCLIIVIISKGVGSDTEKLAAKEEIVKELHGIKIKYDLPGNSKIHDLIEYIKFQLPHLQNVDKTKYQDFIEDIERLHSATTISDVEKFLETAYDSVRKII